MLVAYGVSSAVTGLGREAFGMRQILTGLLTFVIGGGLVLQTVAALVGGWAVGGPEQVPAAWSVLAEHGEGRLPGPVGRRRHERSVPGARR